MAAPPKQNTAQRRNRLVLNGGKTELLIAINSVNIALDESTVLQLRK